ncbi:MAG TPA: sigma-w pathway protein ysdB [Cerasibacillus sp.]|uniref:sigma-w pathway protein ysdB n=1 Tax=Cerasibacillus sp. TaxID=2498711 RepID=UPI002F3E35E8
MVVVYLFRILILIALVTIIYTLIKYFRNPERYLSIAKEEGDFFFLDDPNNSKKNFQIVYKGCSFEGEKYLGTTEESFEVVTIHLSVRNPLELKGLSRDDLYFLEKEILIRYPHAKVEWKHPINQLFETS